MGGKWKVYAMVDQGFKEELEVCGVSFIGYGPEKTKIIPKTVSIDKIQEVIDEYTLVQNSLHFPTSSGVSELAGWSKRISERCERMSERTSEWPSTYVSILVCSRPQCNDGKTVLL